MTTGGDPPARGSDGAPPSTGTGDRPIADGAGTPCRQVTLPGGRTLVIRPSMPADVDGLAEMYASLTDDDLYRRFFLAHVPTRRTVERILSASDRGGVGLVAVVGEPDHSAHLVGEVSYELIPEGGAELGITVARRSRGWLGPYLLDTLIEAARRRGVTNLQAEVLVENRRMLTLLSARGYATMGHFEGPSIVRVVIGTSGHTPPWPGPHASQRVLVEAQGGRWHGERALRAAGFEVLVCSGPRAHRRCPALEGKPCPLASHADLVVDAIPPDTPEGQSLLEAHDRMLSGIPICVEFPSDIETSENHQTLARGADDTAVVAVIQRLVRGPDDSA